MDVEVSVQCNRITLNYSDSLEKGKIFRLLNLPESDFSFTFNYLKVISGVYTFKVLVHRECDFWGCRPMSKDDSLEKFPESLKFGQDAFINIRENNEPQPIFPILHLSVLNMLDEDIVRYLSTFPRYSSIMDSSIWNYYYCMDEAINNDTNHEQLMGILTDIVINSYNGLYKLSNAIEYANHSARIVRESYIADPTGHGLDVSPFLFHSETKRLERVKIDYKQGGCINTHLVNDNGNLVYKWRILLLDDYALKPLNNIEGKLNNENVRSDYIENTPDKLRIISNDIRSVFPNIKIGYINQNNPKVLLSEQDEKKISPELCNLVFHCVSSVNEAMDALEHCRFEIVLLDYLLGKVIEQNHTSRREYSYHLFTTRGYLGDRDAKDKIFGPHGRLYFMFISAFTTAVNERLLAEGLHKSEDYWHIADGACPTNTPYLFLYNLLHLMKKRLDDMGLEKLTIPNYKENKEDFEKCHIKSKIIDEIFISDDTAREENTSVRQRANDKFNKVLSLLYHYKNLLKDTHNPGNIFESEESVLATDFIEKNPDLGGFLEHLMQLVYLTAYGTVRQWPEMWEEYQFIKTVVGVQPNIENYILSLKNNNIGS